MCRRTQASVDKSDSVGKLMFAESSRCNLEAKGKMIERKLVSEHQDVNFQGCG